MDDTFSRALLAWCRYYRNTAKFDSFETSEGATGGIAAPTLHAAGQDKSVAYCRAELGRAYYACRDLLPIEADVARDTARRWSPTTRDLYIARVDAVARTSAGEVAP